MRFACYRLQALSATGAPPRTSDTLCVSARSAFSAGPNAISIVFAQPNVALIGWEDVPGATSYVFLALGTAGGQILPAGTRFALHDTRGAAGCFTVAARSTASLIGYSNFVCGLSV